MQGEVSSPKALSFSPGTEAHGPRATSWNVVDNLEEKLRCLEFHMLVAATFDVTLVGVLKTAFHLLGLIRVHNFASSCAVFSSLPSNVLLPAKLTCHGPAVHNDARDTIDIEKCQGISPKSTHRSLPARLTQR